VTVACSTHADRRSQKSGLQMMTACVALRRSSTQLISDRLWHLRQQTIGDQCRFCVLSPFACPHFNRTANQIKLCGHQTRYTLELIACPNQLSLCFCGQKIEGRGNTYDSLRNLSSTMKYRPYASYVYGRTLIVAQ